MGLLAFVSLVLGLLIGMVVALAFAPMLGVFLVFLIMLVIAAIIVIIVIALVAFAIVGIVLTLFVGLGVAMADLVRRPTRRPQGPDGLIAPC